MTPGKVKQPHSSVESEFEGFCFSAEVTIRKGEGTCQSYFIRVQSEEQPDAPYQRILRAWNRKKMMYGIICKNVHKWDKAMSNLTVTIVNLIFLTHNLNDSVHLQNTT